MQRESVYGPYPHRDRWRVEVHILGPGGREKSRRTFETQDQAREFRQAVEAEFAAAHDTATLRRKAAELRRLADHYDTEADRRDGRGLTIDTALLRYRAYMLHDKGNKTRSVASTMGRLRALLGDCRAPLTSITEQVAGRLYEARRKQVAVDTHRNELGQAKTFMNWCVENGWISRNPFAKVKGVGKRKRGKAQLRLQETRRVATIAFAQADKPDAAIRNRREAQHRESSTAVLLALYLALRADEVINICRRDVDDDGRLLWIPDSKTENGRRTLQVANVIRPLLRRRALECGSDPDARLFPHHRNWLLYNVKRLCRAAGVPEVTAHGARGIHATIAAQMGITSHAVARALGHGSPAVTHRHYIRPGAVEQATQRRFYHLLGESANDANRLKSNIFQGTVAVN